MSITLHTHPFSSNGQKAQLMLDVVGLDYAARLMEHMRLVLEARRVTKRVFATVRSRSARAGDLPICLGGGGGGAAGRVRVAPSSLSKAAALRRLQR